MLGVGLLGLLFLKHALMVHIIDFGYSASRRSIRLWWVALIFHAAAELIGSVYILRDFQPMDVAVFLAVEGLCIMGTAVVERASPIHRLLVRHFAVELWMVGYYVISIYFLAMRS